MKSPGSSKQWVTLVIALIGALVAWFSQRDARNSPAVPQSRSERQANEPQIPVTEDGSVTENGRAAFDFYLLALTLHPAFCADGHERSRECEASAHRTLVIHGLWPERTQPRTYPHDCAGPRLVLEPALQRQLEDFMPGVADRLDEHEWREHGTCSGLEANRYFTRMLELARGVDSALGGKLTTLAGGETGARELRAAADLASPGVGATLTFHCRTLRDAPAAHRRDAYLIEVRQCVRNNGPGGAPGSAFDCASLNRRDTGCGARFRIADASGR